MRISLAISVIVVTRSNVLHRREMNKQANGRTSGRFDARDVIFRRIFFFFFPFFFTYARETRDKRAFCFETINILAASDEYTRHAEMAIFLCNNE